MKRLLCLLVAAVMVLSMLPVMSFATEARTVYLDPASGLDTNDGLTEANPVKTVAAAYAALEGADTGKIVFLSTLNLTALTSFPACSIPVTLTSKTGAEGITAKENIYFYGPTTLEKITFTSKATNNYTLMSAGGHKFTVGKNVTTVNAGSYHFGICGGSNYGNCSSVDLTVQSGTWHNIYTASHGAHTVNGDCKVTIDGVILEGFLSAGRQSVITGDVNISITNSTVPTVYPCSSQTTGQVDGDVTVTLGQGANVSSYVIESNTMSAVKGTNTLIVDGGSVKTVKKNSENASSGATAVLLKSGRIDTCTGAADTVTVDIPAGKTLTLGGQVDATSLKSAGTLCFTGNAELTADAVNGTINCTVDGEVLASHLYLNVPAGSDIQFEPETGIIENNGQWTLDGIPADENFVGLVLTSKPGISVTLYNGVAEDDRTVVTPAKTVNGQTNYYYYEIGSGYYHYVASGAGRYTIQKNIYMSTAEAATKTVLDVTPPELSGDGWEQTTNVKIYTDEILSSVRNDDPAQWPEYADIFTTPYFTEERTAYQMTTQDQMTAFIDKLDDADDNLYVYNAGHSTTYNFPIDAIVVTKTDLTGTTTLEEAAALVGQSKPTILYRTHMHGSEPASGEAALAILQRLDGALGEKVLDAVNIVIIPRNSPDAAYDYTRYLTDGTELNGDLMKIAYPETEAYLRVYELFGPELVLDGHEFLAPTMGSYIEYDDAQLGAGFTLENSEDFINAYRPMLEQVRNNLTDNGLHYRYYTNIVDTNGAASGSRSHSSLQGTMFVLVETHGIGNGTEGYHRRCVSQVISMQTMIEYVAENATAIQTMLDAERQQIIDMGATYEDSDQILLQVSTAQDESWAHPAIHVYQSGKIVNETIVPKVRSVINRSRTAPTAYVIPARNDYIADILALMDKHNIQYDFIPAGSVVALQQYSGTVGSSSVTDVTLSDEMQVSFPNGAYVFCKNQVKSRHLSAYMEPDISSSTKNSLAFLGMVPCVGGRFPIYRYIHNLNESGFIDYEIAPDAPTGLLAQPITVIGGTGSITGLDAAKAYEYRNVTDTQYTAVAPGSTQITGLSLGEYLVRFSATETEKASVDATLNVGYRLSEYTVYLDSANGSDENEGYTQNTAVATFNQAKKQLDILISYAPADSTGTIRIVGTYDLGGRKTLPKHTYPLRITGGTLLLTDTSTSNSRRWYRMGGDTTFDNITIKAGASNTGYYLCGEGYKLTIGENVSTALVSGDYIYIMGGTGQYDRAKAVAQTEVVIQSGTWGTVYAGGYVSGVSGNAKVTLSNCSVYRLANAANGFTDGNVDYSLTNVTIRKELYCGNTTNYDVGGNITMLLGEGVTAPAIYAGSRDGGNILGTVTVIADGIDLSKYTIHGKANNADSTIGALALELRQGQLADVIDSFVTKDGISVKLGCDQTETVVLPHDINLDLNGYDVTMVDLNGNDLTCTGSGNVAVKDSATDDYTVADGVYGTATGKNIQAAPGYLAVTESGKTSYHKYQLEMSDLVVKPSELGLSYKSIFRGDEKVRDQIKEFGVAMRAYNAPNATTIWADPDGKTHVALDNSEWLTGDNDNKLQCVYVEDIISTTLDVASNRARCNVPVYGRAYIELTDGTMLFSNAKSFSMQQAMEHADLWWNEPGVLSDDNKTALRNFFQDHEELMNDWSLPNINP